jgi:hypothetical protein
MRAPMFLNVPRETLPNWIARDIPGDPVTDQLTSGL